MPYGHRIALLNTFGFFDLKPCTFYHKPYASMQARGAACHIITGDNWVTARMIAHRLGIRHVTAEVLHPNLESNP